MTEIDLEKLALALQEEGLIIRLTNGSAEELAELETSDGEMIYLRDLNVIFFGEEGKPVKDLSQYIPIDNLTSESVSLDQRIKAYWQRLINNLVLGEVGTIVMPKAHAVLFEQLRPKAFSFVRGGEIPAESDFFGAGWTHSPDLQGTFTRKARITQNETGFTSNAGEILSDLVGTHDHDVRNPVDSNPNWRDKINPEGNSMTTIENLSQSGGIVTDTIGDDNRPVNMSVLRIWKIKEF